MYENSIIKRLRYAVIGSILFASSFHTSHADLTLGNLDDFEDASTQGWGGNSAPQNIATGGTSGAGDNFLQIGGGNNFAVRNTGTDWSGALGSSVTAIQMDLMRPATETPLEMRIVLFGPDGGPAGNRWTSSTAQVIPDDGVWRTYTFSLLEADLTRSSARRGCNAAMLNSIVFDFTLPSPNSSEFTHRFCGRPIEK